MANMIINFEQLQSMYQGNREYPVTERGMLQLIEACEREMSNIKRERSKVNAYAKVIRDSIGELLKRLDKCRNGELLPFDGQDEPQPEENIRLDTADWRDSVDMTAKKKSDDDDEPWEPGDDDEAGDEEQADA